MCMIFLQDSQSSNYMLPGWSNIFLFIAFALNMYLSFLGGKDTKYHNTKQTLELLLTCFLRSSKHLQYSAYPILSKLPVGTALMDRRSRNTPGDDRTLRSTGFPGLIVIPMCAMQTCFPSLTLTDVTPLRFWLSRITNHIGHFYWIFS